MKATTVLEFLMKRAVLATLSLFLASTTIHAAPELLTPIGFGKGVDYTRSCTDVADDAACDSSNMVGDRRGAAWVRNGSKRLITQAVSTQPFTALYRTVITTAGIPINVLIGVSGDTIYYSTSNSISHLSILYRGLNTPNQKFSFATAMNLIYMTGDALTDPIYKWDVPGSSFSAAFLVPNSTYTAYIYAKYLLYESNYLFAANVREIRDLTKPSTYYDDRVYYSYLLELSSFTLDRVLNISLGDGEYITGMTTKRSVNEGAAVIEVYKPSSIHEVSFTKADPIGEDGDIQISRVAQGFGNITDSPPQNLGDYDAMFSKEGLILWDGGRRNRLSVETEKTVFSENIRPIIQKLIDKNSYRNAILKYYPKNKWIIFAYEDPNKFPKGVPNSCMIYDLITGQWWPLKNWIIGSMEVMEGFNDDGKLIYGDGKDGHIHITDDPSESDDARREISIDPMESMASWFGSDGISTGMPVGTVMEGTASIRLTMTPTVIFASMSRVAVLSLGEYYDKSVSSGADKISFKVFPSSIGNLQVLRVDLQVGNAKNQFDDNYSSIIFSSVALTAGTSAWSTLEVSISSFPLLKKWIDISSPSLPFANNFTRFGIRFVSTSVGHLNLYFDDVRFVSANKTPLNPERLTKRFNFGTLNDKDFIQVILSREKQRNASFQIDMFTGFGKLGNSVTIAKDLPKELFVCGFQGSTGIAKLSGTDFSFLESTQTNSDTYFGFENGAWDGKYLFTYDVQKNRLTKIESSSMTVIASTFGSFGTGQSNFDYVQEIALEKGDNGVMMMTDHMNNRIKVHSKSDLSFIQEFGQLGTGTTSLWNPTGIDFDDKVVIVGDDGNQRLAWFDRNFNFIFDVKLDINVIGNITIKIDGSYVYIAYNKGSPNTTYFYDVILEKRNKGDGSLITQTIVRPMGVTVNSTYTLRGSIGIYSKFVLISFSEKPFDSGTNYIQKRLTEDLSIVSEYSSGQHNYGVIGDNLSREPVFLSQKINLGVLSDPWLQLRFYSKNENESSFKLNDMTFYAEKLNYTP